MKTNHFPTKTSDFNVLGIKEEALFMILTVHQQTKSILKEKTNRNWKISDSMYKQWLFLSGLFSFYYNFYTTVVE